MIVTVSVDPTGKHFFLRAGGKCFHGFKVVKLQVLIACLFCLFVCLVGWLVGWLVCLFVCLFVCLLFCYFVCFACEVFGTSGDFVHDPGGKGACKL